MMFKKLRTTGLNKFRRIIAACLAAASFLVAIPAFAAEQPFPDLDTKSWYYTEVIASIDNGLFKGGDDGLFRPDKSITRAEFIAALSRLASEEITPPSSVPFKDIKKTDWYYNAIGWAYKNKIVSGVSATAFKPNDKITREQMCVMLGKTLEYLTKNELSTQGAPSFWDERNISAFAVEWVKKCTANEIILGDGYDGMKPLGTATRAQAAIVINRCYEKYFKPEQSTGDYSVSVSGFSIKFDPADDYYLATPTDFTKCKITGYKGFKSLSVSVEQYASHYPYLNTAYKLGDYLDLGYGRAKVTLTATLQDGSVRNYTIALTDPRAEENAYAKVRVNERVNLRAQPNTNSAILGTLTNNTVVYYVGRQGDWAKIQWVQSTKDNQGVLIKTTSKVGWVKDTASENYIRWNWEETQMPAQYADAIAALKKAHPNWSFTFVDTEMTFASAVSKYGADKKTYIDPAYYLTEDRIFALLDIDTYDPSSYTAKGIEAIWVNTNGFSKAEAVKYFQTAAGSLQMNPYYIACRTALESAYGTSAFSKGMSSVSNVTDKDTNTYYEKFDLGGTYYNFYGIGAYDSNPRYCMIYAMRRGWSTKEIAITEGANWVKDQYLDRGAVTPYFFRYSGFWNKSYMSDAQAPLKEASILKKAYSDPNAKAHFIIPVYRDLPTQ